MYGEGNVMEGNKWGPCSVGSSIVNFGKTDDPLSDDYNPGNNIFRNNTHTTASGQVVACDFCNQTKETVYAQGNTWNDAETAAEASATIFGSNYNAAYGPIIFDPVHGQSGVKEINAPASFPTEGNITVCTLAGVKVFEGEATSFNKGSLRGGAYIVNGVTMILN